jgi:gamma-glutamylcyclotransferase (GGCT)/AIG2-like uncharacterized protein YtfP
MFKSQKEIPLAVYGTLRKGYANYADHLKTATFVGTFRTKEKYRLIIEEYPCVLPFNNSGHHIEVDLFMIDSETLSKLDQFEGHPYLYRRTEVLLDNGVFAWLYIRETRDTEIYLMKYTDQEKN